MQNVIDAEWEPIQESLDLAHRKQRAFQYLAQNEKKMDRKVLKIFCASLTFFLSACAFAALVG